MKNRETLTEDHLRPSAHLSFCPLITSYQRLNAGKIFTIFFVGVLYKTLSREKECPENRRISSSTVLGGSYEFLRLIYLLLYRCGLNLAQQTSVLMNCVRIGPRKSYLLSGR